MAAPTADWPAYDRWNAAIAEEFFAGRYGGRPVYLDLEDDALARIATAAVGDEVEDPRTALIGVVRQTLYLLPRMSIFRAHRRRLRNWKLRGNEGPPPVIAVLALLSLIAEQMTTDLDFRASNYYGRFLRTLGYSASDRHLRQKVVRCFAEESHVLWDGLNDWLGECPQVRGRPTAYAFDYRIHVGVPMSQALVRDADRAALHELFVDYRLSPGQQIPHADMVRLLREWLPQSPVSSMLKQLARHEDALLRIADVACIELEAWEGTATASVVGSRHRLAFIAGYRRHPRPRLSLGLAVRVGRSDARELELGEGAGPAAIEALIDAGGRLELTEPDEDGWADVANSAGVSMAHALVTVLELRGSDMRLRRIPRRLVVLERDEERRRFVEVERVRLGDEYLLLAADTLGPLLDEALAEAARPGWTRHDPDTVGGVPTGWRLYTGIEIVGITPSRQIDLAPLIPIAWTQLTISGGLALPGRGTWLASASPEVSASSLAGDPVLAVLTKEAARHPDDNDAADQEVDSVLDDHAPSAPRASDLHEPVTMLGDAHSAMSADDIEHDELNEASKARPDDHDSADALTGFAPDTEVLGRVEPAAIFALADLELGDGRYRVTLVSSDGTSQALSSATLTLRSPDPRQEIESALAHQVGLPGLGALSADASADGIQGAAIPPEAAVDAQRIDDVELARGLDPWQSDDDHTADEQPPPAAGARAVISLPTCMETGAHYFKLPPSTASKGQREIHAVCEHCGVERFFPARPRRRGFGARRSSRAERLVHAATLPALPARPADPDRVDFDRLLEATSAVGSGDWRSLERLVDQMDDSPWAAVDAVRTQSALGHLDVMLDRYLRPARWSIAPATLVASAGGAFLAGWRSDALLGELGHLAVELGGRVIWQPAPDAPTVIRISDLAENDLEHLAARLSSSLQMTVEWAADAARALATQLPSLATLRKAMREAPAPLGESVERFEPATGRWTTQFQLGAPGGYRTARLPRRFWHFDGADWRVSDNRLVKWLSATPRERLLAYDRENRALACHLGAQLPGLYERAAVLCSGEPPQPTDTGHVVYRGVSANVAAALARALTTKPREVGHAPAVA